MAVDNTADESVIVITLFKWDFFISFLQVFSNVVNWYVVLMRISARHVTIKPMAGDTIFVKRLRKNGEIMEAGSFY
jgi:hypothetical protein